MARKNLKNKPLVEAILEIRWKLQEKSPGVFVDPNYKLVIGRLYDRLNADYPYPVELPTSNIPADISAYVVQQQFRKTENEWPLIQIGPGIITLNDTKSYIWEDFEERARKMVDELFDAYPTEGNNLEINSLLLRYIDAIDFDFDHNDIYQFIHKEMGTTINLNNKLFDEETIDRKNHNFDFRFVYPTKVPKGMLGLRFARGLKTNDKGENKDALIWETRVQSEVDVIFDNKEEIVDWIVKAHEITDSCFFNLISDDLLRRFE
ncbi:TIGR04255 family protein [Methanocella arvoryzae]|uniref:TIGR04255 family protein n=1 Tax=Methanocella arvoryzae (strain DSM 22066 / NBRC 105507 / MRE50) TaxID=351160 RepID=Q0W4E7_METAR|nr:TIGR04255 family protein [Methanocella arvoryzae]CAJ36746.1 hypothetical protein RCIX1480 [Methanocella arvoryzae MRE50]